MPSDTTDPQHTALSQRPLGSTVRLTDQELTDATDLIEDGEGDLIADEVIVALIGEVRELRAEMAAAPTPRMVEGGLYRNPLGAELRLAYLERWPLAPGIWSAAVPGLFGDKYQHVTAEGLTACGYTLVTEEADEEICPGCDEPVGTARAVDEDTGESWHAECWAKEDDRDGE